MIKLFREQESTQADVIEAEFHALVLGYDRVLINAREAAQQFGAGVRLPVITNNDRVVSGIQIPGYIKELTRLLHDWQWFQGDACYVDDDGESC